MAHAGLSSPRAFPPVPHSSPTDFGRLVLIVIIFPGISDGTADDIGRMVRTVRLITAIGNSLGVTLPRRLLKACGLHRGSLVEVLPANNGLLVRPSRIVPVELADVAGGEGRQRKPGIRVVLGQLKAGLSRIYGVRFRSVYLYGPVARAEQHVVSDFRVFVVLDNVSDYGAEIERTGGLISRLSLLHAVSVSRIFMSEQDWRRRRREGVVPL